MRFASPSNGAANHSAVTGPRGNRLPSGSLVEAMASNCAATGGIRPREAQEFERLDLAEHDLNAYPDFQQTMIKSYDMRQA